jgi:tRNA dimethylallyltransferase
MENNNQLHEATRTWLAIITGPTGVGKTRLSTELAELFDVPVISADSRQMYREMKTGTAVPSPEELKRVRHYFIGNLSIHDYYNASMFEVESIDLLEKIFRSKNLVFMAGGSGLYIDAVCRGIDDLPSVDPDLRNDLAAKYQRLGTGWLRQMLKKLDPDHYQVVDLKNPNRMLKAVEISLMTGKPYSTFLGRKKKERNFGVIKIGLQLERKELYERINRRVDEMVEQGLIGEAEGLYPFRHLNALNTVGYKELFEYFSGKVSLEKAIELIKRNSRHYAKRQMTWLARNPEVSWFHPADRKGIIDYIEIRTGLKRSG